MKDNYKRRYEKMDVITVHENELVITQQAPVCFGFSPTYYEDYISYIEVSEKTIETYTRALRQFARFLENHNITLPEREHVIRYKKQLIEEGKEPTTISSYLNVVKCFFKWTASAGIYPNVADNVKGVKVSGEHKRDYFTVKQINEILGAINRETLKGARDFAIIYLMATCGLRTIEVTRANVNDLRPIGERMAIYVQGKGHNAKDNFVIMPENTEHYIREYLKKRTDTGNNAPLFASVSNRSRGGRMTTRSIRRIVHEHIEEIGFNDRRHTAHSLRHSAVTIALKSGQSLEEAQEFARHSNISTTMIYNHALKKENNNCSNVVSSALDF